MKHLRFVLPLLLVGLILLGGCTLIKPSDTVLIDERASNSRAMSNNVDANGIDPVAVKQYLRADAAAWQYFSDIAHRRTPTTQPVR